MSLLSSGVLALSLSADAYAVSISKGLTLQKPKLSDALKMAAIFGVIEALTPFAGWFVGRFASGFIENIDHWIAFIILSTIGVKFIYESFKSDKPISDNAKKNNLGVTALTALATSIDAFAVGLSWAFVKYNILITAIFIGIATFTMVTLGLMIARRLGSNMGRYAERIGGLTLILIGVKIVLDHMNYI